VQSVEAAEGVDRQPDDRDDGFFVGTVERDTAHPLAGGVDLGDHTRHQFAVEIADDKARAFIEVALCKTVSDAAETRKDDDLVREQSRHDPAIPQLSERCH